MIQRPSLPAIKIHDSLIAKEPFFLLTFTEKLGEVPPEVAIFMKHNYALCRGLIGSGNRNFGTNFCGAINKLHQSYGIPILHLYEVRGMPSDVLTIQGLYKKHLQGENEYARIHQAK